MVRFDRKRVVHSLTHCDTDDTYRRTDRASSTREYIDENDDDDDGDDDVDGAKPSAGCRRGTDGGSTAETAGPWDAADDDEKRTLGTNGNAPWGDEFVGDWWDGGTGGVRGVCETVGERGGGGDDKVFPSADARGGGQEGRVSGDHRGSDGGGGDADDGDEGTPDACDFWGGTRDRARGWGVERVDVGVRPD